MNILKLYNSSVLFKALRGMTMILISETISASEEIFDEAPQKNARGAL